MIPLPSVCYINDCIRIPFIFSEFYRGEVCGRIITGSIGFSDNERLLGKPFVLGVENHQRTFIFLADFVLEKFIANRVHLVPVETFP